MPGEDINGFAWRIGWSPWLTILSITLLALILGALVEEIVPITIVGLLLGIGIYFYGTRVVNSNYEDLLDKFISDTERSAARGIDVADANTYSLTKGESRSPIFVKPNKIYRTTAVVVTPTSVNINQGAKYKMPSRSKATGGSNRELFYDQITAVESHQNGHFSTLEIRTAGGESIEVDSRVTDTVDDIITDVRKRLRAVKSGRDPSMGNQAAEQGAQEKVSSIKESTQNEAENKPSETSAIPSSQPDNNGYKQCLSCGEDIDPETAFCPMCGVESPLSDDKVEDANSKGGNEDKNSYDEPNISEITENIHEGMNMDNSTSKQLCKTLSNPNASEDQLRSAIETAVEELETSSTVQRTIKPADRYSSADVFKNIRSKLKDEDGDLVDSIEPLVNQLVVSKQQIEQQEDERDNVNNILQDICQEAKKSDVIAFETRDNRKQAKELVNEIKNGNVELEKNKTDISAVADDIDRQLRPKSEPSRALLRQLREPGEKTALSEAIKNAISVLDDYAETQEILSDITRVDVERRLESLERELNRHDTEIHTRLAARVRELSSLIKDSNADDMELYSVYQEVTFYDRTLLPGLNLTDSQTDSVKTEKLLEETRELIGNVEKNYLSVRADHNHSIPKHFLKLSEDLADEAEQTYNTEPDRAVGILIAVQSLLNHIEELYERNEYSVMLRRLRG